MFRQKSLKMIRIKLFLLSVFLFAVFDSLWLGVIMKDFNLQQLSEIGRFTNGEFQMNYFAAALTYFLMGLAVTNFVLPTEIERMTSIILYWRGAQMGLIIYGVFDMTNLAILKNYPVPFIIPDILWGTFVFGLVSVIVFLFYKRMRLQLHEI